jgi:hypothetical protein
MPFPRQSGDRNGREWCGPTPKIRHSIQCHHFIVERGIHEVKSFCPTAFPVIQAARLSRRNALSPRCKMHLFHPRAFSDVAFVPNYLLSVLTRRGGQTRPVARSLPRHLPRLRRWRITSDKPSGRRSGANACWAAFGLTTPAQVFKPSLPFGETHAGRHLSRL